MKIKIGTVTGMTIFMGLLPLAATLIVARTVTPYVESWSPETFGIVFTGVHFAFFLAGAWIYAIKIGN